MADKIVVPDAIVAENELAQLLHDWAARWVDGHDPFDRASCFSTSLAQTMVEGGSAQFSEMLVRPRKTRAVLVCSACLKTWEEGHDCGDDQKGRAGDPAVS